MTLDAKPTCVSLAGRPTSWRSFIPLLDEVIRLCYHSARLAFYGTGCYNNKQIKCVTSKIMLFLQREEQTKGKQFKIYFLIGNKWQCTLTLPCFKYWKFTNKVFQWNLMILLFNFILHRGKGSQIGQNCSFVRPSRKNYNFFFPGS